MSFKQWQYVAKTCVSIACAMICAWSFYNDYSVTLCVSMMFVAIFIWEKNK